MTPLVVVAWPEDGGKDAACVMESLIRHALRAVASLTREQVRVEPPPATAARLAVGQAWRSKSKLTELARAIVTQLAMGRVVVLHADADTPWPDSPTSLDGDLARLRRAISHGHTADNFVVMIPYPMIEGWTYRNLAEAERQAQAVAPTVCAATHSVWSSSPALLETTPHIKDRSPLRDQFNRLLVETGWPREQAYADGRSFRRFADALASCPRVVDLQVPGPPP